MLISNIKKARILPLVPIVFVGLLSACNQSGPESSESNNSVLPQVSAATVVHQEITEWDEFTGRLQAPENVALRARVSGYIKEVKFREGERVSQGDVLFIIDDAPFQAEVDRLEADLVSAKSGADLSDKALKRAQALLLQNAISKDEIDRRLAKSEQQHAQVDAIKAALNIAKLNLSYTQVTSPISGRASNALLTMGNYVRAGSDVLTHLVSTDRVYAYFDADEQTFLTYLERAKLGSLAGNQENAPVWMSLTSEKEYPHQGYIDFIDNQVDPVTGTIKVRAVFDNLDGQFVPGLFARIRVLGSQPYEGILISDKAVSTDLNNKFVLIVNADNKVDYRAISLGEKVAGLRVVKSGLQANEQIIVNGLQRVRPGAEVSVEVTEMMTTQQKAKLASIQQTIKRASDRETVAQQSLSHNTVVGG